MLLGACGKDERSASSGGGTSALSEQAGEISDCLSEAGLEPVADDTLAFGVEDPFDKLEIALESETFDETYQATIYVFEDNASAEKNRPLITLQDADDERQQVIGNVLLSFDIIPDERDATEIEGCILP